MKTKSKKIDSKEKRNTEAETQKIQDSWEMSAQEALRIDYVTQVYGLKK